MIYGICLKDNGLEDIDNNSEAYSEEWKLIYAYIVKVKTSN